MTAPQRWLRLAGVGLVCALGACGPSQPGVQPREATPPTPPPPPPAASYLPPNTPKPLVEAQQFLQDAPAYRSETIVFRPRMQEKYLVRIDVTHGGAIRVWEQHGNSPQLDLITDGAREFVVYDGKYIEEHGDAAGVLAYNLERASLVDVLASAGKITAAGEETVNGTKTTVFLLFEHEVRSSGSSRAAAPDQVLDTVTKFWLNPEDYRPLKAESETRGMFQGTASTTYIFDPSIKVALPVIR